MKKWTRISPINFYAKGLNYFISCSLLLIITNCQKCGKKLDPSKEIPLCNDCEKIHDQIAALLVNE